MTSGHMSLSEMSSCDGGQLRYRWQISPFLFDDPPFDPSAAPYSGDERVVVAWMLDYQRYVLLRKLDGINDEQARRTVTAGDLTMLGLARHLAFVEQFWFGHIFLDAVGRSEDWLYDDTDDPDIDLHPGAQDSLAEAIDQLHTQIRRARGLVNSTPFDSVAVNGRGELSINLRWILVHLAQEYARHCGHADLIREAVDGRTGD